MYFPDTVCAAESPDTHTPARAYFQERLEQEERNLTYRVRELSEAQTRIDHLRTALAHLPS